MTKIGNFIPGQSRVDKIEAALKDYEAKLFLLSRYPGHYEMEKNVKDARRALAERLASRE